MDKSLFWQRAFIVLMGIFIFRIGSHIPVPQIDPVALSMYVKQFDGTMIEILNTFSGGSVKRFSILAVGIMPYITASILIQMFGFFSSHIKQLRQEGEKGNVKINKYVRNLALLITLFQATSITTFIAQQSVGGMLLVSNPDLMFFAISILSLSFGTMFLIWLGERLTDYGIGSGISTIIFAGIISNMPTTISELYTLVDTKSINILTLFAIVVVFFAMLYLIVKIEYSQRRIPITTNGAYNDKSYLPIKINVSSIMPTIFAVTIIFIPFTLNGFISNVIGFDLMAEAKIIFGYSEFYYVVILSAMIMFFTLFYSKMVFNTKNTSDNLQASGSFINGIRPGNNTKEYLDKILYKLSIIGGLYMVVITILPEIMVSALSVPFYMGGTSILIMILIAKEWMEQYELSGQNKKYENVEKDLMSSFK